MQVTNLRTFRTERPEKIGPRTLHGVAKGELLLVQSSNERGEPQVTVIIEANGKRYAFPRHTWDDLGVPCEWLDQQIVDARRPIRTFLRRFLLRAMRVIS